MKRRERLAVSAALMGAPGIASAHLVSTRFGELYSGLLHPLTTLIHLVPWLALGIFVGLQPARTGRWALLVFPAAVVVGLAAAAVWPDIALVSAVNLGSFVLLGVAVTMVIRPAPGLFVSAVALLGLTHGHANAADGLTGMPALLFSIGVVLSAYLAVTLAAATTHAFLAWRSWGQIAVRAIGSWVTAAGAMYVGFLALG